MRFRVITKYRSFFTKDQQGWLQILEGIHNLITYHKFLQIKFWARVHFVGLLHMTVPMGFKARVVLLPALLLASIRATSGATLTFSTEKYQNPHVLVANVFYYLGPSQGLTLLVVKNTN